MNPGHVAAAAVLAGWFIVAAALLRGYGRSRERRVVSRDFAGWLGIVLQAAGFAIVAGWRPQPALHAMPPGYTMRWPSALTVLVTTIASSALLVSSVRTLGKQWSIVPRLLDRHTLVEIGPYAVVRHPIYTSLLGLLIATGLTFTTGAGIAGACVLYLGGTALRIRREERLLLSRFGARYLDYMRRVPAVIPFVRR